MSHQTEPQIAEKIMWFFFFKHMLCVRHKSSYFKNEFANGQDSPIFFCNMVKSKIGMCTDYRLNSQKSHQNPYRLVWLGGVDVGWEGFPQKTFKHNVKHNSKIREGGRVRQAEGPLWILHHECENQLSVPMGACKWAVRKASRRQDEDSLALKVG